MGLVVEFSLPGLVWDLSGGQGTAESWFHLDFGARWFSHIPGTLCSRCSLSQSLVLVLLVLQL